MKRTITVLLAALMLLMTVTGCAAGNAGDAGKNITVVSREDGSGTRGAFIELFGVEVKGEDGTKKDLTTKEALIVNKTDVMLTNIASDPNAIGYVSLGSLNNTVKALSIDGVAATAANVQNGTYSIARPFIIATRDDVSELAATSPSMKMPPPMRVQSPRERSAWPGLLRSPRLWKSSRKHT